MKYRHTRQSGRWQIRELHCQWRRKLYLSLWERRQMWSYLRLHPRVRGHLGVVCGAGYLEPAGNGRSSVYIMHLHIAAAIIICYKVVVNRIRDSISLLVLKLFFLVSLDFVSYLADIPNSCPSAVGDKRVRKAYFDST